MLQGYAFFFVFWVFSTDLIQIVTDNIGNILRYEILMFLKDSKNVTVSHRG